VKIAFDVPTQTPISYPIASIASAPNPQGAAKFLSFLGTAPAQAVLAKYGFQKP
jgi:molybdate transport system substrate-binding protein